MRIREACQERDGAPRGFALAGAGAGGLRYHFYIDFTRRAAEEGGTKHSAPTNYPQYSHVILGFFPTSIAVSIGAILFPFVWLRAPQQT